MVLFERRSLLKIGLAGGVLALMRLDAGAQQVTPEKLLAPGPLPEKVLGNADARVTVIEYASMSCGSCVSFHMNTWPALKAKYVDTGKIRFIFREFPLDLAAAAAAMLARCAGDDKWYPMVDLLFRTKESWAHANNPADALGNIVRQAGITRGQFEACLNNESMLSAMKETRDRATKEFGVNSTPTFFINGRKEVGALTIEKFDQILEPLLAQTSR
jgi:protein-disulfide isomerase